MTTAEWISARGAVVHAICEAHGPHIATDVIAASKAAFLRENPGVPCPPDVADDVMFAAMQLTPK
jgi:hypothetical protein